MSFFRDQLEQWLGKIDVIADRVVDIGGGANPVKDRIKSWVVKDYRILDNELESPVVRIDFIEDINEELFDEKKLSYIAGIVDGEGCISVTRKEDTNCYTPQFGINMRESGALNVFEEVFGFKPVLRKKSDGKDYYSLQLGGDNLKLLLRQVYPYLRIKKEQAELCLELRKNKDEVKPKVVYRGGSELPKETIEYREKIYNRVKLLNHYQDYFDIAFCLEVAEYWWNPLGALKTIHNFLREGGIAYLSFPFIYPIHSPHQNDYLRYTRFGILKLLEIAGFKQIEITERKAKYPQKLIDFYQSDGMHIKADSTITGYLVKAIK